MLSIFLFYDNFFYRNALPNFGHMTTSKAQLESNDKVLLVTSESKTMTS